MTNLFFFFFFSLVWPEAQLHQAEQAMRWTYGWSWSCPENTPLKDRGSDLVLNDMTDIVSADAESQHVAGDKTFIADFDKSIDYCMNPDLMSLVSGFAACGLSSFPFLFLFLFFSFAEKIAAPHPFIRTTSSGCESCSCSGYLQSMSSIIEY